jgi:hypothetical protein
MRGRGLPHWLALPFEMLSTCTYYRRLYWRWFGYVSPSYCTTWSSLVLARFRFLLDHVSGPCCSTCQFSTGTRVVLPLDHVSLFHWTMCRIFYWSTCPFLIWPHVTVMSVHMSYFYTSMWRDDFLPVSAIKPYLWVLMIMTIRLED